MEEGKKTNSNQNRQSQSPLISWNSPEFYKYERGWRWKISMAIFLATILFLSFFYGSWTFSLVILTIIIVYFLIHEKNPKTLHISIFDDGIQIGNKIYPYQQIESFWIIESPPFSKSLYLKMKGKIIGEIKIILPDRGTEILRKLLRLKIEEEEGKQEPFSDQFMRLFKL